MGLLRVVHVEAHLLDRVEDVRPGEGEILESPGQAAVGCQAADRGDTHVEGDLGLSVNRCGAGLAVTHTSALNDVSSVLALVKEEAVASLLHWDVEKVVEGDEVLNGELLLESRSGALKKLRARGGEDGVIDVEKQIRDVGATVIDEQWGVRLGLHEAKGHQIGGKAVVPSSWCML
jgi:hypothetical protein